MNISRQIVYTNCTLSESEESNSEGYKRTKEKVEENFKKFDQLTRRAK